LPTSSKNLKLIAFGGKIDKSLAWSLSTALHFQPDGDYAKWIAKAEPADGLLKMFPDAPKFVAAVARVSAQLPLEGAANLMPSDIPADKREALAKELAKLVQQVSDVGLCVYAAKANTADTTSFPLSRRSTARAIGRHRPSSRRRRLFGTMRSIFLKHTQRAAKLASDVKTQISYQEKDRCGQAEPDHQRHHQRERQGGNLHFLLSASTTRHHGPPA